MWLLVYRKNTFDIFEYRNKTTLSHTGTNVSNPTPETTSGIGGPCPMGFYCPEKTEDPVMCPNGTFRDLIMGESSSDCFACSNGMYCAGSNLTLPTGPCSAGFYCLRGNNEPMPNGKLA